jgi:hypothetical protein
VPPGRNIPTFRRNLLQRLRQQLPQKRVNTYHTKRCNIAGDCSFTATAVGTLNLTSFNIMLIQYIWYYLDSADRHVARRWQELMALTSN